MSRWLGPAPLRLVAALGVVTVVLTLLAVSATGASGLGGVAVLIGWPAAAWFPVRLLLDPPERGRGEVLAQVALPWRGAVQHAVATRTRPAVPEVRAAAADLAAWQADREAQVRWRALVLSVVLLLAVLALLRADPGWRLLLPTVVVQLVVVTVSEVRLRRTARRFADAVPASR